jgi:hypothetical protein
VPKGWHRERERSSAGRARKQRHIQVKLNVNAIVRISVSVVLIMIFEAPLELLRKICLALKGQSTRRSHHNISKDILICLILIRK